MNESNYICVRFQCKIVKENLVKFSHVDICFEKRGSRNERCCTAREETKKCVHKGLNLRVEKGLKEKLLSERSR